MSNDTAATANEKTFQAEVTEEYQAEDDSQLSIKLGQIITVYGEGEDQNGWFYGFLASEDGKVTQGYFPSTYVTPLATKPDDALDSRDQLQNYAPTASFGGDSGFGPESYRTDQPMISNDKGDDDGDDATTIINTYTKHIEWIAAFALLFSGVYSCAREEGSSKTLGAFQLIFAFLMFPYLLLKREEFYDAPCILRAGIWFVAGIFSWAAAPVGLLGGGACSLAMIFNVLSHLSPSGPSEQPYIHARIVAEVRTWSPVTYGLIAVWAVVNLLFWFVGKGIGAQVNKDHKTGDQTEGIEAWGVLVSFNIMWMILMSCGEILHILRQQLPMPFAFLYEHKKGINFALVTTIFICSIAHLFAVFGAYNDTNSEKAFKEYYGGGPLATGSLIFYLLVMVGAIFLNPSLFINGENRQAYQIFQVGHNFAWPVAIVLLFFHGKGGWGPNFWKFMIAPIILYAADFVLKRQSGGSTQES